MDGAPRGGGGAARRRSRARGGGGLRYEAFERAARRAYDDIPDAYKTGVDGLVVSREARPHPDLPDVFTLGECLTEAWPSEWQGPETLRSVVILYWGSFRNLARLDPEFDWGDQLWETLTHELRHHLESLAADDQLEGVDYALDEGFKRYEGLDFDPWYYQRGDPAGPGVYRVEEQAFVEQAWSEDAFTDAHEIAFEWEGRRWAVPRPERLGDVHFVWVDGVVEPPAALELVLVRRRSWWEDVKRVLGASRPEVLESEAAARPLGG